MNETYTPRRVIGDFQISERKPKPRGATKYVVTKSGDTSVLKDFGRHSVAVRWCKAQLPRENPHVLVVMEGGLVQAVLSTVPCDFTIVDADAERTGSDDVYGANPTLQLHGLAGNRKGSGTVCYAWGDHATVNPTRVKEIIHAVEAHEATTINP